MLSPISPWISFLQKQKPDYHFDKATAIRSLQLTCNFGNPAIPRGPVAFRPTIARGLALSIMYGSKYCYYRIAILMPRTINSYNTLIFNGFQKNRISEQ
jgi:hypothetical protein